MDLFSDRIASIATVDEYSTSAEIPVNPEDKGMAIVSDRVANIVTIVNLLVISSALSLLGITTNIINILIFFRQGFEENVNINLFALSLADIFACITQIMVAICYNPLLVNSDLPFKSNEVDLVATRGPHVMAVTASAWLTGLVTFERCICVTFPLKVKAIMTKKRMTALVVSIFLLIIILNIPFYSTVRLDWKFVATRNRTMVGLVYEENSEIIEELTYFVFDFLSLLSSFFVVSVCTIILTAKLNQKRKWRQTTTATTNRDDITSKEKRIVKMVVMVAVVFIIGYTPAVIFALIQAIVPEFRNNGEYANNFIVALATSAAFESVNASVNIFIYYNMSTKYRTLFRKIFGMKETSQ